jgi:hypothetical protein
MIRCVGPWDRRAPSQTTIVDLTVQLEESIQERVIELSSSVSPQA